MSARFKRLAFNVDREASGFARFLARKSKALKTQGASIAAAVLIAACATALPSYAQEVPKFQIAGLTLGTVATGLDTVLAQRGFGPISESADSRLAKREANRTHDRRSFQRRDGHILRVGIARQDTPVIKTITYEMGGDIDSYGAIYDYLHSLFGNPVAIHGSESSVQVIVWQRTGTDQTIEGILTTGITLTRDPVAGHTLVVREYRQKLGNTPVISGKTRVNSLQNPAINRD